MMIFVFWALAIFCLGLGFLGCFINKVPGPLFVVIAMVVAKFGCEMTFGWGTVSIVIGLAVVSIILSKLLVNIVKQFHTFNKRGAWGTTLGSLIGLCVLAGAGSSGITNLGVLIACFLVGLVLLPFVFAFLFELTLKAGMEETTKCAVAATSTYLADTCLKLVVFGYAAYTMFFN